MLRGLVVCGVEIVLGVTATRKSSKTIFNLTRIIVLIKFSHMMSFTSFQYFYRNLIRSGVRREFSSFISWKITLPTSWMGSQRRGGGGSCTHLPTVVMHELICGIGDGKGGIT